MTGTRMIRLAMIEAALIYPHHHKEQNADEHNNNEEAGAAAFVLLGAFPHVVHREGHAVLDTVDALVFRAVIHEGAADVFHPGNQFNVRDKDRDADDTL